MKKSVIVSVVVAGLMGGMALHAEEVKGEAAAKAKVEEVHDKEAFKAKQDIDKFKNEVKADVKKVDPSEKAKELEAKDKAAAPTKTEAFKEDSKKDVKKTLK